MSKRQFIMILAIWIAILPFLGFTLVWNRALNIIASLVIVTTAYLMVPATKSSFLKTLKKDDGAGDDEKIDRETEQTFIEHHGQAVGEISKNNIN